MKQASIEEARKELYNVVSIYFFIFILKLYYIYFICLCTYSIFPMVIFHMKHMICTRNLMVLHMI